MLRMRCTLQVADALTRDLHYTVDEKQRNVLLTEEGYEAVEDVLQVPDLYDPRTQWASFILNALKVWPCGCMSRALCVGCCQCCWATHLCRLDTHQHPPRPLPALPLAPRPRSCSSAR